MPLVPFCLAVALAIGACSGSPANSSPPAAADTVRVDTTLYPSAAVTDGDPEAVVVRDLDALGVTPIGLTEAEVTALFGAPDRDERFDLADGDLPGELRVEVYNTIGPRLEAGEAVVVRELTWALPNAWRRIVWLHNVPDGWAVADALEWAADRVAF